MARIVSFIVLLAILLVIAGLFLRVMADFLLPMFLAVLLVIVFRPLHAWLVEKCRGYDRLAAGLTTGAIVLIFLVPLTLILWQEDDEFPARCSLLFDETCELQLPPDILWSVAMLCSLVMLRS